MTENRQRLSDDRWLGGMTLPIVMQGSVTQRARIGEHLDGRANRLAEGDLDEGPDGAVGIMEGTFTTTCWPSMSPAVNRRGDEINR